MTRTIVLGGAGFLGSHLCKKLVERGDKVICIDNLITGKYSNIKNMKVEFYERSITEPFFYEADLIFNLASPASPVAYQRNPIETMEANSIGMKNALDCAQSCGARIIQASTSEVYGNPEIHPQPEDYWGRVNPNGIRSCYDESKRYAEALCMSYYREYSTDVVIARIFNTYGPNMRHDDGRAVPNFIYQALRNRPITIYGTGCQTRSFCYVSDLVDGLLALSKKGKAGEVYNVGNPEERTIYELSQEIVKLCGSKSKVIYQKIPQDDPTVRCPNIRKITQATGWKPKVGLEEGLTKTIKWFREGMDK